MEIFKILKNLFKRNKNNMLDSGKYSFNSKIDDNYLIEINDLRQIDTVIHSNGRTNKLMIANIEKYNGQYVRMITDITNNYKCVVFEVPENQVETQQMIECIARQYDTNSSNKEEFCQYFGEIILTSQGFKFMNKSNSVQEYIKQKIEPQLITEKQQKQAKMQQEILKQKNKEMLERQKREFKDRINSREEANRYYEKQQKIKSQRLENPYLIKNEEYQTKDGKYCSNWEGINIQNGEILRLYKLKKIGKIQENGQYLYSGIVLSTPNTHDTNMFNKDTGEYIGNHICFELPNHMETLIKTTDENQYLQKILNILSNGTNSRDNNYIYAGGIKQDGNVSYDMRESHPDIRNKLNELRQEYELYKNDKSIEK